MAFYTSRFFAETSYPFPSFQECSPLRLEVFFKLVTFKFLSDSSSISVIPVLAFVDCFLLTLIGIFWFSIYWIVWDCILEILNLMRLWVVFKYYIDHIDVFFLTGNRPGWFQASSSSQLLWIVTSISILFSKTLQCFSDLSHIHATPWPVWDRGRGLSVSSVLKVFDVLTKIRLMNI